ncbi:MAG: LPS export ABC transporter permease LptF [Candidatus Methylopumilus sp.]|nr:LPS export ABC transporter permease LptF [Candidatus Methylopumilus sp.]
MLFKTSLKKELLINSITSLLILIGIVMAQRISIYLRFASKGIIPNDSIKTILGLNIIKYSPLLLSLSIFLAILLTLSRWYRDHEMIIWLSSGISLTKIVKSITSFAIPAVAMVAFLSLFLNPWAVRTADEYKSNLKTRDELSTLTPGTFKESKSSDRIFFIESFDELGNVVKNIFVQTKQHNKLGVVIANNGHREISNKGDSYVIMQKGRRYEGVPYTKEFSTTEFDQYGVLIAQQAKEPYTPSIDSKNLSSLIQSNELNDRLELQWRLSSPIACILLVFLAVPLSFTNPRAGRSLNIIFAVLIFIIYNNLLAIMNTFITLKKIDIAIGFWPIHLIFLLIAIYLTYKRSMNQPILSLPLKFSKK